MLAEWTGEDEFREWSRREWVATERYRRILERLRAEAVIARGAGERPSPGVRLHDARAPGGEDGFLTAVSGACTQCAGGVASRHSGWCRSWRRS